MGHSNGAEPLQAGNGVLPFAWLVATVSDRTSAAVVIWNLAGRSEASDERGSEVGEALSIQSEPQRGDTEERKESDHVGDRRDKGA